MKADLGNPGEVDLTGRCHRLKTPSPWKQGGKKALWIALAVAGVVIILVLLVLLILQRGPAH